MKIQAIKTTPIRASQHSMLEVLNSFIPGLVEGSIVAITSKIISLCEGNVVKAGAKDKHDLIKKESEMYIDSSTNSYGVSLTIKNNILIASAGIDESNGDGYYILWPKDPQKSANEIREYLSKKYSLKNFGIIITDSKTTPLRWGTTGICIAYSGFNALKDYRDKPDIFERKMLYTQANIADGLAASAVLVMGEGNEQTPLALIEHIPFVEFQNRNPTAEELKHLHIDMKDDLYGTLLQTGKWMKNSV